MTPVAQAVFQGRLLLASTWSSREMGTLQKREFTKFVWVSPVAPTEHFWNNEQ